MASISDAGDCGEVNAANLGLLPSAYAAVFGPVVLRDAATCLPLVLRPRSRGRVSIRGPSVDTPPAIDPQYLSHPDDVGVLVEGANMCKRLMRTPAMQAMNARPNPNKFPACSHLELLSDEYLECQVGARRFVHRERPVPVSPTSPPSPSTQPLTARRRGSTR